jgi:hypothetical protein
MQSYVKAFQDFFAKSVIALTIFEARIGNVNRYGIQYLESFIIPDNDFLRIFHGAKWPEQSSSKTKGC